MFSLLLSLVSAVQVSTNKNDYNSGEIVSITVSDCVGTSILKIRNPEPSLDTVDIKAGEDSWSTSYNTLSDSADGKYTVSVSCTNGPATTNFCVNSPGCLGVQAQEEAEEVVLPDEELPVGGRGLTCLPQWSCSEWSFCNAQLQETRDCIDLKACSPPKEETRPCDQCLESWICSLWSECSNGLNARNCVDEHACGTVQLKPGLQKSCQQASAPGPQPRQISSQLAPPSFAPPVQPKAEKSIFRTLWEDYRLFLILSVVGLIALVVVVIVMTRLLKPQHFAYNLNELKEWVKKESAMGTSTEDIRTILKQHTGWKDDEIDQAFENLRKGPMPKQKPLLSPDKPLQDELTKQPSKEMPGKKMLEQPQPKNKPLKKS